jgi:prepilin-type N-terminal cleavage/methylation domain-containing protein
MRPTITGARQRGFTLVELLVVLAIIVTLSSIAVPHLLAGRRAAHEASAVQSVRVLSEASHTYHSSRGSLPSSLSDLSGVGMIDPVLAGGEKDSYVFTLERQSPTSYVISARPSGAQIWSGARRFAVIEDGRLRADTNNLGSPFTHDEAAAAAAYSPD